jgi:hypothetical protein
MRRRNKDSGKTKQRLMFRIPRRKKIRVKTMERLLFRLCGEEIKIQAKQRSGCYFAMWRENKDSGKTEKWLLFRRSAKK